MVSGNDLRGGLAVGWESTLSRVGSLEGWLPGWVFLGYPSRLRMIQDGTSTGAGPSKAGAEVRSPGQEYSRSPFLPQGVCEVADELGRIVGLEAFSVPYHDG